MLLRPATALFGLALAAAPPLSAGRLGDSHASTTPTVASAAATGGATVSMGGVRNLADSQPLGVTSRSHGYAYLASSTLYGQTPATACGGVDTVKLVEGTGYIAVASAQAMQPVYDENYGGCGWECHDETGQSVELCEYSQCASNTAAQGCTCRQVGACWCGQASSTNNASTGTASMGCFSCAKARFLSERPYGGNSEHVGEGEDFVGEELKVVVADACPYGPNSQWCPARPGDVNSCGLKNHFDFTVYPAGLGIDNNFVVFTPEPCSEELQQRIAASSKCSR